VSSAPPLLWSAADIAVVVVVTTMGVIIAYLRNPEHKATVLMLPVPFTLTTLAVGRPIDCSNVLAVVACFGYAFFVWLLHERLKLPILAAIAASVAGYCLVGVAVSRFGPAGGTAFWTATAATIVAGVPLVRGLPHRVGRHHRTPLPVWVKTPAVAAVAAGLVATKHVLGGFTTMFPLLGMITSYESRHSLWTIVRRMAWMLLLMPPMLAAIRLLQPHVGLPWAMVLAWPVYLACLWGWHRATAAGQGSHGNAIDVHSGRSPKAPREADSFPVGTIDEA